MNWFKGSIAEAVTTSKQKNATFVVYVEGKDENSVKLTKFLDQPVIKEKLERECFVAIKIEGGSEAYMQFARIYQIVPLPSLFFIGKNGTPLEIATGIIGSSDELDKKIENVLRLTGKGDNNVAASASAAFISGEQRRETVAPIPSSPTEAKKEEIPTIDTSLVAEPNLIKETVPSKSSASSTEPSASFPETEPTESVESKTPSPSGASRVVCTGDVCVLQPNYAKNSEVTIDSPSDTIADSISMDTVPTPPATPPVNSDNDQVATSSTPPAPTATTPPTPESTPITTSTSLPTPAAEESSAEDTNKLEQAKQLVEERRKLKQAEEDRQERERELNRRKDGKNTQNVQQWQKEQDFKELKESIRRDRMEDQATRQRILEQIASDRAERAQKFTPAPTVTPTTLPTTPITVNTPSNLDMSRIQFRIPNGETNTQTFDSSDTFATIRAYVKGEVIKGTGIKDFTLATTFPKHEFTADDDSRTLLALGLCPSAVILIIAKTSSGPSAVVARSGGFINIFNTIFWALLSPVMAAFGYLRNFIIGRNDGEADARPANSGPQKRANEERVDANDLAKKRNLDRFLLTKEGPSTSKEALATANSTGGAYRRVGGSNVHRLSDQRKDSDDENNTWNGNSTQQQ